HDGEWHRRSSDVLPPLDHGLRSQSQQGSQQNTAPTHDREAIPTLSRSKPAPEHPAQPHSKYPDRGDSNLALGSVAEPKARLMEA
ncbi:MAG: hypothetical protein VXW84_05225, partial [Verrucomicrobiota bacterium]|nr:hypothetical protein [Verrucomicrobiota bacterium]